MPLARAQDNAADVFEPDAPPADETLVAGLRQRARLFELILSDLLGPRTIVLRGLLPTAFGPVGCALPARAGLRWYEAELISCADAVWRVSGELAESVDGHSLAGLFEAPALAAFLPGLCRFLMGELLLVGSVPVRWLGDAEALSAVVRCPNRWAVVDAFRRAPGTGLLGLTPTERAALQERVGAAPWRFAALLLVTGETARVSLTRRDDHWMVSWPDLRASRARH